MRVAAGAVARKVIPGLQIRGALVQIGEHKIDRNNWDDDEIDQNDFFCPDKEAAKNWATILDKVRKDGSSIGAIIELTATGVPLGLGAPVYAKLDQDLASALMSINAVKAVEIGAGFDAAALSGEQNADEIRQGKDSPQFLSNKAGGILGGISSGQPVIARFAVKPTSSIRTERKTINRDGSETIVSTKGRHDPCVGIRAVPVGEAMMAIALADHYLRHRGQVGGMNDLAGRAACSAGTKGEPLETDLWDNLSTTLNRIAQLNIINPIYQSKKKCCSGNFYIPTF